MPDLLRTMPVKPSVKDENISNQMTMGKFGEVGIDGMNGLDWKFVKKTEILEYHPRRGSSTPKKDGFGSDI